MFINEINIVDFRVLEDIIIRFQTPNDSAKNKSGNVVNVVAGITGTGKTSLLEAIITAFHFPLARPETGPHIIDLKVPNFTLSHVKYERNHWKKWARKMIQLERAGTSKVIFLGAQQSFKYKEESKLENRNTFIQKIDPQKIIGRAESFIKEYVLGKERTSRVSDPTERSRQAVDSFNEIFAEANLLTRLSNLSPELFNMPIFENAAGKTVLIDQLSDGEKQLYGRLIALMILNPHNSIILIDEPEIALHPAWQQIIMKLYSKVGKNNQFIVATHSPQVIASVPYQNRIILHKENGKIVPIHCDQPPSGVDVNTILSELMFASPHDPKLLALYKEYRTLVEDRKENTERAVEIKTEIGKKESQNSEFMQEMQFFIELRDV